MASAEPHGHHDHGPGEAIEATTAQVADGTYETRLSSMLVEVSKWPPDQPPTATQQAEADRFLAAVKQAAVRWQDRDQAEEDGFTNQFDHAHLMNDDYLYDGIALDPEKPETLVYNKSGHLDGVMFLMPDNRTHGHQFGGPLTRWHYHDMGHPVCWDGVLPDFYPDEPETCADGSPPSPRSPEMLHVWIIDNPRGPFDSLMNVQE